MCINENCPYIHDFEDKLVQRLEEGQKQQKHADGKKEGMGGQAMDGPIKDKENPPPGVCVTFWKHGKCGKGRDKCIYRHVDAWAFRQTMRFPPDQVAHLYGPSMGTLNHLKEITRCSIGVFKEKGVGNAEIKSDSVEDGNLAVLFVAEIIQKGRQHR